MEKHCICGELMDIKLRTVIFSGKVSIENVPIYSCSKCERSIVHPDVKSELSNLLRSLGGQPEKKQLYFNELNELAYLLVQATRKDRAHIRVEQVIAERVNELLDLLLLAQSLQDDGWSEEVRVRLSQIARMSTATY